MSIYTSNSLRNRATLFLDALQTEISSSLELIDGSAKFHEDNWERPGGGGGRSRVMNEGAIFEKAGVNFSSVYGTSPAYLTKTAPDANEFYATGVSLVLHPHSPKIPTIHANFRYFELSNGNAWFGGGIDLTPYYLDKDDAKLFHKTIKSTCDKHNSDFYPKFKLWADDYFLIRHRNERRGIGGIFYDHLGMDKENLEEVFKFHQDIGRTFIPSYKPIVEKHRGEKYSDEERRWQLLRRGRYVEFNLVYDKGTVFGLETGGRIESILMSLPTVARWEYDQHPTPGSPEDELQQVLIKPIDWV